VLSNSISIQLKEYITTIRTKKGAQQIVGLITEGQVHISELMELFFSEDWVVCQKASWPISHLADKAPQLLLPYMQQMIDNLNRPNHDAVIRNTIRAWQVMTIPEKFEGPIYDKCFEYFADPQYAVAIRVFAMTVCTNIAMRHHSLAQEIIPIIEDHWDHGTAAWRSRGKKELKRLHKIIA